MFGLVFIYFIGKAYYELAKNSKKSEWGYAILGVLTFYLGTFLGGLILGLLGEFGVTSSIDEMSETIIAIIGMPVGMLTCYLFYQWLKSKWSKSGKIDNTDVLDGEYI